MKFINHYYYVLFMVLTLCSGFNLDVDNLLKYRGRPGSMFGFTVAQHSYRTHNWLIVGAPEDQSDIQSSVTRGGVVYRCDVTGDTCEQVFFDRNGDNRDQDGNPIDIKSNQWFGATLTSSNGSVLACAPRYVYTQQTSTEERRDPVGTCWLSRDQLKQAQEFSPCRNRDWGYHRHGSCQAGLGGALSKDGGRLYIGAPGSCFWQGSVHSVAATTKLPFVPPKVIIIQEGKIHSQNTHNRADVISSSDGPYFDDDSYLGYSVTSGRFDGGLEAPAPSDIAVGVPKGERLNGKVVLFTYNMTHIRNITGEQLGAYFGYAMAACDIDADGYDDLIVGAPMYTEEGNHEGFFETGRIYVFYAGYEDDRHVREGDKNNRARFGHSIACLGDVNRDGYNDFAVGAPYEKDGERGAVYIYHGSKQGAREKYSQVIRAEEIPGSPLTFGFSVAGGIDMDQNQYPDLSVGAYESNQAFLFKARPVVDVISSVTFDSESKQISLEEKNCTLKDRSRVPCVKMDACLRYEGLGVESLLDFEIQVLLDARKPKGPRLAFLSEEGRNVMNQTVRLDKGRTLCSAYWVYLKPNIRDKLTSLDAELWYSLTNRARISRSLAPVLNSNEILSAKDTLAIQKNCGRDNICIPDLRLIASPSVEKYVLGSGKRLEIEVEVQNEGEDAFESSFELFVPSGLNYVKIERKDDFERDIPVQCSPPSFNNNNTLHCDIGNPLPRDKLVKFVVLLQPYYQKTMNSTYNFAMSVNSTNPERNRTVSDNFVEFVVPIWVVTELSISGSSRPVDVYYNSSQYVMDESQITKESQIGPQVAHLYTITNKGPSEFYQAKATILWPSYTLKGEPLLYLLEEPETSGDISCRVEDEEYNVKRIKLERKGKSYFEDLTDGELGETSAWTSQAHRSEGSVEEESYSKTSSSSSSSRTSSSGSSSSATKTHLSREERLKFEEEERRREADEAARLAGDGSDRHIERAKARVQGKNHYSRNGGKLESDSYSSGYDGNTRNRMQTDSRGSGSNERRIDDLGGHTKTKSSERTSYTTWGRGGGRTETTWREEEDGIVRNGSNVVEHENRDRNSARGIPGGDFVEQTYERESTRSSSSRNRGGSSWRSESKSGSAATDIVSSGTGRRRQEDAAGTRTSEQKTTEWNTTWSSGGRPVTSKSTSWRKEDNRPVVGSGDRTRTHEGSADVGRQVHHEDRLILEGGTVVVDDGSFETSRRRGEGTAAGTRTAQGKSSEWNSTWTSGGSEHTATHKQHDGSVIGSGDRSRTYDGSVGTLRTGSESVHEERSSTREGGAVAAGRHRGQGGTAVYEGSHGVNWRVEGDSATRQRGGAAVAEGVTSRRRGHGGGGVSRVSEERNSEWNTTWTSGGHPVTSEHASWRREKDGLTVGSGEHSRTFEGTAEQAKTELESRLKEQLDRRFAVGHQVSGGDSEIEHNIIREGGDAKTYKKDWEEHYNTTWGTSTGNRPVTVAKTTWTIEEDGKVSTGGSSKTYEGVAPVLEDTMTLSTNSGGHHRAHGSHGGSIHSGTRHHERVESRTSSGGSVAEDDDDRSAGSISEDQRSESRRTESSFRTSASSHNRGSGHRHHLSTDNEGDDAGMTATSHREETKRTKSFGGAGSSSIAGSVGESAGASGLDLGAIARGPGDGKARTYVADLGILESEKSSSGSRGIHRTATDEEKHHHSASRERHHSFGGEGATRMEGSDTFGNARGSSSRSGYRNEARYASGRTYSTGTRNIEGDPDLDPDYESRRTGSGGSFSHSWSSSYSSQDGSEQGPRLSSEAHRAISNSESSGFKHYRRERRYADDSYDNYRYDDYDENDSEKKCTGPVKCTRIVCTIGALKKGQEVHVAVRSRLWLPTVKKIAPHVETVLGSQITAKVTLLPTIGRPSTETMTKNSTEIKTRVMPEPVAQPDVVPLWIVVLSAVCGALILMLLVYILYKLGFFKRNRPEPSTGSEKTPLNRNGHYQGDEPL